MGVGLHVLPNIIDLVYQVFAIYNFDPEPDPHFWFLCEQGAWRRLYNVTLFKTSALYDDVTSYPPSVCYYDCIHCTS